ncbi:MAG TPA: sugar ABC transporter permease [Christensenellaceae bacterium]|jgi:raffinose/stachyose/melibiose transport system permease protein|nr:sugar ABC transporter permease [Christensenellaceae bacterium]
MKNSTHSVQKPRTDWRKKGFIFAFLAPTMVMFCIFYLYPLVTVFFTSFCKWDYTNITRPEFFGWKEMFKNYKYIFNTYPYFWEAMRNSTAWALLGVFFQIPLSTIMALAFSRKMKGVKTIRNIYIVPCMISSAAMGMIFLQLYNPLYGVVNPIIQLFNPGFKENILLLKGSAFWALTAAYIFFTGTTTLMILGNILAVPEEVREAATLDGASGLLQDWHIIIPMIRGTLKTVSILAATSGFLLYNEVFFLTKGAAGTYSVSYIIRELAITSPRTQFGRANSVAFIQIICGLLIIVFVNLIYSVPDWLEKVKKGAEK